MVYRMLRLLLLASCCVHLINGLSREEIRQTLQQHYWRLKNPRVTKAVDYLDNTSHLLERDGPEEGTEDNLPQNLEELQYQILQAVRQDVKESPTEVNSKTGWSWSTAEIPPIDVYDCIYLYYSCTDFEEPGWPENKKICTRLFDYCHYYIQRNSTIDKSKDFIVKIPTSKQSATKTTTTTTTTTTTATTEQSTTTSTTTTTTATTEKPQGVFNKPWFGEPDVMIFNSTGYQVIEWGTPYCNERFPVIGYGFNQASINSQAEFDFITDLLGDRKAEIGGKVTMSLDRTSYANFEWFDGSSTQFFHTLEKKIEYDGVGWYFARIQSGEIYFGGSDPNWLVCEYH